MTWRAGPDAERRSHVRHACGQDGIGVTVRPGLPVAPIDQSAGGVLVESVRPLRPGAMVDLQIISGDRRTALRGRVVRCVVSQVQVNRVWYRGAISFDKTQPWLAADTEEGYPLPVMGGVCASARGEAAHRGDPRRAS